MTTAELKAAIKDSRMVENPDGKSFSKAPKARPGAAEYDAAMLKTVSFPKAPRLTDDQIKHAQDSRVLNFVNNTAPKSKRIRQSSKPLMNGLEAEWFQIISARYPNFPRPRPQALKFKLANGVWYRPDFSVGNWPMLNGPTRAACWECKGGSGMKGVAKGIMTLKIAAATWPEVRWILVWKSYDGFFQEQEVLP